MRPGPPESRALIPTGNRAPSRYLLLWRPRCSRTWPPVPDPAPQSHLAPWGWSSEGGGWSLHGGRCLREWAADAESSPSPPTPSSTPRRASATAGPPAGRHCRALDSALCATSLLREHQGQRRLSRGQLSCPRGPDIVCTWEFPAPGISKMPESTPMAVNHASMLSSGPGAPSLGAPSGDKQTETAGPVPELALALRPVASP